MRKTSTEKNSTGRNGLRLLAAVALTGSLAAFGCTTNRTPGYGEPGMSSPAAGSLAPNVTSTPGSANTMGVMPQGSTPQAMISSSPANGESASVDALADIKADQAYRGRVLGPAAPGDNSVPSLSMQQTTGQFVSPALYANPQVTVNSSISSAPTPAIISGAGGDSGGAVGTTGAITANAAANGVQNVGVTGVSSATATPITNATTANAPAPASNVVATPMPATIAPLATAAAATVTGTSTTSNTAATGVTGNLTANTTALSSTATPAVSSTTTPTRTRALLRGTTSGTTSGGLRVMTGPNGSVMVTNQSQSAVGQSAISSGVRAKNQ